MAIQTLDQGNLDFGRYRENVQDTYAGPVRTSNDNAEALVSSLARFSGVLETVEAKREENTQFAEQQKFEQYVAAAERDGQLGSFDLAAAGRIAPQASFRTQALLTEKMGQTYYSKLYQEQTAELLNDPELATDPSKLQAWREEQRARILEETKGRDFYQNGALAALDSTYSTIYGQLTQSQAQEMKAAGREAFLGDVSPQFMAAQNTVMEAARTVGIDPGLVVPMLSFENKAGDPNAQNPMPGQTASGLMQITDGTWAVLVEKYGAQYGLTLANKNDPKMNAIGGALYAKENYEALKSVIPNPTAGDVYGAHFLGPAGYKKVLSADPGSSIKDAVSDDAWRNNKRMFTDENGEALTVAEFREKINGAAFDRDPTTTYTKRFDGATPFQMDSNSFASKHYQWTDFKNNGEYGGEGQIDGRLVNMLDAVTDQFGRGKFKLTSAYRDADYNKGVSFTKSSRHSHGDAIDIDVSGYSDADKEKLISLFVAAGARGLGHYDNGTIHVDLRPEVKGGKDITTWYGENKSASTGAAWFNNGIDKGRNMRDTGVVPVAGFNGQALNAFDARVKSASQYGMTEREARDVLAGSIMETALASRNAALLDQIPMSSVPLETQNKVLALRTQIADLSRSENQQKQEDAEKRKRKAFETQQQQIIQKYLNGENVDLAQAAQITYVDENGQEKTIYDPQLLEYAKGVRSSPVEGVQSKANSAILADNLQNAAFSNSWDTVFKDNPHYADITRNGEPSQADLINKIASDPTLNAEDKAALIAKVPAIKATQSVIKDQIVTDTFTGLNDLMKGWESMKGIAQMTSQYNPELRSFISGIRTSVKQTYEREYLKLYRAALKASPDGELGDDVKAELAERAYQKANDQFVKLTALADAQTTPEQAAEKEAKAKADADKKKQTDASHSSASPFKEGDTVTFTGPDGSMGQGTVGQIGKSMVFVKGADGVLRPMKPDQIKPMAGPDFGDVTLDEAITGLKDYLDTIK